jgi:general stress protein YciG
MKTRKPENQVEVSGQVTVQEAGARGGRATRENKGVDFFKRIGAKGGRRTAELYADLLKEFGKRGGRPRRPTLDESMGERDH